MYYDLHVGRVQGVWLKYNTVCKIPHRNNQNPQYHYSFIKVVDVIHTVHKLLTFPPCVLMSPSLPPPHTARPASSSLALHPCPHPLLHFSAADGQAGKKTQTGS